MELFDFLHIAAIAFAVAVAAVITAVIARSLVVWLLS